MWFTSRSPATPDPAAVPSLWCVGLLAVLLTPSLSAQTAAAPPWPAHALAPYPVPLQIEGPGRYFYAADSLWLDDRAIDLVTGFFTADSAGPGVPLRALPVPPTSPVALAQMAKATPGSPPTAPSAHPEASMGWLIIDLPHAATLTINGVTVPPGPSPGQAVYARAPVGFYRISARLDGMSLLSEEAFVRARDFVRLHWSRRELVELLRQRLPRLPAGVGDDEPGDRRPPDREPVAAACQHAPVDSVAVLAEARLFAADYDTALDCYTRYFGERPNDPTARTRLVSLTANQETRTGLTSAMRTLVDTYRGQMRDHIEAGDREALRATATALFELLPGDLLTRLLLQEHLPFALTPGDGPPLALRYVPGVGEVVLPADSTVSYAARPGATAVPGFYLGATEVTNAQFAAFLNVTPNSEHPLLVGRPAALDFSRRSGWSPREGAADLPVVDATWYGAAAYAAWAGGRLPTAAEWTWAYTLGQARTLAEDSNLRRARGRSALAPVGTAPPDALGLMDMLGNAWEWLAPPTEVAHTFRERAGGSFATPYTAIRQAPVGQVDISGEADDIGFRIAYDG